MIRFGRGAGPYEPRRLCACSAEASRAKIPADMKIANVSDTARWVATYRAMETERPDAIFRDPFARRLAGPQGQAIVDAMPKGRQRAWAMIVRTAVFDEMILAAIRERRVDLVLNLAAGLDARPWRLPLPEDLRWVDVDLPEILGHKTDLLRDERPRCRYEAVTADLSDGVSRPALLARLTADAKVTLVVSEGLLIYLLPEQVGEMARDLIACSAVRAWLLDLANPFLLGIMQRDWGKQVEAGKAPFLFAPAEGPSFFETFGWRVVARRSTLEEAHRLQREQRGIWLWRWLARLAPAHRREAIRWMASYTLLERG